MNNTPESPYRTPTPGSLLCTHSLLCTNGPCSPPYEFDFDFALKHQAFTLSNYFSKVLNKSSLSAKF